MRLRNRFAVLIAFCCCALGVEVCRADDQNPLDQTHALLGPSNLPLAQLTLFDKSYPSLAGSIGIRALTDNATGYFAPGYLFMVEPQLRAGKSAPLWMLGLNYCDLKRGYEVGLQPLFSGGKDGIAGAIKFDLSPDRGAVRKVLWGPYSTNLTEADEKKKTNSDLDILIDASRGPAIAAFVGFSRFDRKDWTANIGASFGGLLAELQEDGGPGIAGLLSVQGLAYRSESGGKTEEHTTGLLGVSLAYQDKTLYYDDKGLRRWRLQFGTEYQRDTSNRIQDSLNVFVRFRVGPFKSLEEGAEQAGKKFGTEYKNAHRHFSEMDTRPGSPVSNSRENLERLYRQIYEFSLFVQGVNHTDHVYGAKVSKAF